MFSPDIDAHGRVVLSAEAKRRQVALALCGQGIVTELANELAILGDLDGICGDDLHAVLMAGTILTAALARQTLLNGATGLLFMPGMNLTAQEAFAHIAAKGLAGTTGVFLRPGLSPPITNHVTSVGCEARCELAALTMLRDLQISAANLRKVWAFAEACWSGIQTDRLRPVTASGGPLLDENNAPLTWWQHVATALLTSGGVVVLDVSVCPSGPVALSVWQQRVNVPNNHPGQTQVTMYGQPPVLGGQPRGRLGYATLSEPLTIPDCFLDANHQMVQAKRRYPLPNL